MKIRRRYMNNRAQRVATSIHAVKNDPKAITKAMVQEQLATLESQAQEQLAQMHALIQQAMVDTGNMLRFNELICGILYAAITDDMHPESACQEIPGGSLLTGGKESLYWLREGIRLWCLDVCDPEKGPTVAYNNALQYFGGSE